MSGTPRPFDQVYDALKSVTGHTPRRAGNQWSARCPAHDDRSPSLSLREASDGKVLVNCHAGCTVEAIVRALGLSMRDLMGGSSAEFPTPKCDDHRSFVSASEARAALERTKGPVTASWAYHRLDGEVAGHVLRWDHPGGKDIRPISRVGSGWIIGAMSGPRPLYRLREVAANQKDMVFVVEGEKSADAAVALGLTATTSAGGAKAAHHSDWSPLAEREVVILPDNDDPGRAYADDVTRLLQALTPPATVRVFPLPGLPVGGDVVDFVAARRGAGLDNDTIRDEIKAAANAKAKTDAAVTGLLTPIPATPTTTSRIRQYSAPTRPAPVDRAAYFGLPGRMVELIEPHTEADPFAICIQFLVAMGNLIGRGPYFQVEGDRHHPTLNAAIVGETAEGRKGTSWGRVAAPARLVDEHWADERVVAGGMSSGEGLIWAVRDPIYKREPIREGNGKDRRVVDYQEVETDPGETDKRLLIVESEFAGTLKVMSREGNTLSPVVRRAWDGSNVLRSITKNSPAKATGAHISIIGHITREELLRHLDDTELLNGFGNRFLWISVHRSKYLPDGGGWVPMDGLASEIRRAITFARTVIEVRRDNEAKERWHSVYPRLSRVRTGLVGAALARGAAQVTRLSLLYALLDQSNLIRLPHLEAALAVWEFAVRSAEYIFGDAMGDPTADEIVDALRRSPDGLSRDQIRDLFGRHKRSNEVGRALGVLSREGRAICGEVSTGGRPREVWRATANGTQPGTESLIGGLSAHTALSAQPHPVANGGLTAHSALIAQPPHVAKRSEPSQAKEEFDL